MSVVVEGVEGGGRDLEGRAEDYHQVGQTHLVHNRLKEEEKEENRMGWDGNGTGWVGMGLKWEWKWDRLKWEWELEQGGLEWEWGGMEIEPGALANPCEYL